MIILDTNVVSEPLRQTPSPAVLTWLDGQSFETLFLTTISLAELRFGLAALPEGRRKRGLTQALETRLVEIFGSRILPFDTAAASAYGAIRMRAKSIGRAIGVSDGYIAAIAVAHSCSIATRDNSPFDAAGVRVVNPWDEG